MTELEGFEFLERLGSGGMSTVWKARQCSLDREVAIKVLLPSIASTPEDVERFMAEARTAGRLKHPGVVQVYDAVFKDGVYCFVMELVDGYTVGDWVRRKGRIEEAEALDIADCVAEALDYAWQQFGMVHCDIKPDNVMVDSDGTVKLTDLGLSRTVSALRSGTAQPEDDIFGTPAYIAPEQAMGEPDLDCRADMYSLGAMLYHLVTGRMLFEGEPPEKVMELQVSGYVPAVRTLAPEASVPFECLVEKLLAKDRRFRHADWGQVRQDIRAVRIRRPLASGLPQPKASTMLPDPSRPVAPPARLRNLRSDPVRPSGGSGAWKYGLAGLAVVLLLVSAWMSSRPSLSAGPPPPSREISVRVAALLEQAERWAESHPGQHESILKRFQPVIDLAPHSAEAERARAVMLLCRERLAEQQSEVLEASRKAAERRKAEEAVRRQKQESAAALAQREREQALVEELLRILLDEGIAAAKTLADARALEAPDLLATGTVLPYRNLISGAFQAERTLLQSFAASIGKDLELQTRGGKVAGKLLEVSWSTGDLGFSRFQGSTPVRFTVNVRDLSLQDRLARMGTGDAPGLRLARALHALEQGAYDYVRAQVRTLPAPLQRRLLEKIPPGR